MWGSLNAALSPSSGIRFDCLCLPEPKINASDQTILSLDTSSRPVILRCNLTTAHTQHKESFWMKNGHEIPNTRSDDQLTTTVYRWQKASRRPFTPYYSQHWKQKRIDWQIKLIVHIKIKSLQVKRVKRLSGNFFFSLSQLGIKKFFESKTCIDKSIMLLVHVWKCKNGVADSCMHGNLDSFFFVGLLVSRHILFHNKQYIYFFLIFNRHGMEKTKASWQLVFI